MASPASCRCRSAGAADAHASGRTMRPAGCELPKLSRRRPRVVDCSRLGPSAARCDVRRRRRAARRLDHARAISRRGRDRSAALLRPTCSFARRCARPSGSAPSRRAQPRRVLESRAGAARRQLLRVLSRDGDVRRTRLKIAARRVDARGVPGGAPLQPLGPRGLTSGAGRIDRSTSAGRGGRSRRRPGSASLSGARG